MSMCTDHSFLNIGENRGRPRIYMQGLSLGEKGFVAGSRYNRDDDIKNGVMRLTLTENGDKKVSGKKGGKISVIDINNNVIGDVFEGADSVRIDIQEGFIEITIDDIAANKKEREASWWLAVAANSVTEGTLFAGFGMATLALHESFNKHGIAMATNWVVERDARYIQAALDNNPSINKMTQLFHGGIERIKHSLLSAVNICQFSAPCLAHSRAGKSKKKISISEQDVESVAATYGLLKSFEYINAAIYVSENVVEARDSATYLMIKAVLKTLKYNVHEVELDNQQSGSFENRKRYWLVAVSEGLGDLDMSLMPTYVRKYNTLGDLMEPISDNDPMWSDNDYLKAKSISDKAAGKGFAKRQLVDESATQVGTINRLYHKKQSTPPMIIRAQDEKERLLTIVEHARAKSCDESLVDNLSQTIGHQCLGQGIDMNQGRGIGELICLNYFNREIKTFRAFDSTCPTEQLPLLH